MLGGTTRTWSILLVGLLLVAACSSAQDGMSSPSTQLAVTFDAPTAATSTLVETTTTVASASSFSVTAMLGEIPASMRPGDGELVVVVGDLDVASEHAGVDRPPTNDPSDLDALLEWLNPVQGLFQELGSPTAVPLPEAVVPTQLARSAEIAEEFGWSVLDVGSYVELQHPPESFAVLEVGVSADDLTAAIGEPLDAIWRLGPDEDGSADLANRTAARPLGEALRFGLADSGLLGVSRETAPVTSWLKGESETLVDDKAVAAVAGALDELDVYAATIVDDQVNVDVDETDPTLLSRFDLLGAGLMVEEGEATGAFVYHYPSAADAEAAVDATRALFTDGVSVFNARPLSTLYTLNEVVAEGENVIATFTFPEGSAPINTWRAIHLRDIPTVHA